MQSTGARVGLLAVLAAAAVVLFIVLNNDDSSDSGSDSTTTTSTQAGGTAAPQVIEVKDGAPVGGVQKIEVDKGDTVNIEVRLDQPADVVDVHGYEIQQPAETSPVHISFPATIDGSFEMEVHEKGGGEFQIAELTVNP